MANKRKPYTKETKPRKEYSNKGHKREKGAGRKKKEFEFVFPYDQDGEWVSLTDCAERNNCSINTARNAAKDGNIKREMSAGRWRYRVKKKTNEDGK